MPLGVSALFDPAHDRLEAALPAFPSAMPLVDLKPDRSRPCPRSQPRAAARPFIV
jgi:hypothetical protein